MRCIAKIFTSLVLITSFATLVACTKDKASSPDSLVVALGAQPNTLDPRFATDANGMRIVGLLFNSLVRIGPDLKVVGDAAESWEYDEEKKIFRFVLRPGLTFSNGRALTAEDIRFSFAEFQSKKNPFHSALEVIESVDVKSENDRFVVDLKLKEYSAKLLNSDLPVVRLLPKEEVTAAGDDFSKKLVGTGSFVLKKEEANEIVLEARKDHPVATPKVKSLVFKVIRDDFTRYQKTLKGAIDIAQAEIPPAKVTEFEKRKDEFQVFKYPGLSMSYILVNLKDPLLSQKNVREAIARSINRNEIIEYKLEGLASEATSILTPGNPYFHDGLENPAYDQAAAKKMVEDLNLKGKEITLKTSNNQTAVDNGRVISNQLSQAGLNVKLQSFEWGTFYGDITGGNFQLATMRWVGAMDPDIYRIAFHSGEKPPGRNRGAYENKELDKLLEKGLTMANEDKRIEHYKKVQEIVQEDLAIIPLWYDQQVAVVHKRVRGYEPAQNGDFSPFLFVSKESE